MLKWLFGKRAAPVVMNLQEIRDRLELDHERFGPDPKNHIPVLDALGEYTLRGSSFFGPARTFYTNPDKTVTIKGAPSQFSDVPDPGDEQVQSAAFVSYTEQTRGFGKRNFALIIRQGANTVEEMENSLAFGLFGLFDKQGNMTVKKIIMPGKDAAHRMTPAVSIPLTPENVDTALRYAEICANTLYSGEMFFPRLCLDQAAEIQKELSRFNSPQPAP